MTAHRPDEPQAAVGPPAVVAPPGAPNAVSTTITTRQVSLLVLVTLIWGTHWPVMKFALADVSPLWFRFVTVAGGIVVLALWVVAKGQRLVPAAADVPKILLVGLCNVAGWHGLSIFGLSELPAGRAGVLGFTMPIWAVVLGALLFGAALTRRSVAAAACVAIAVALLTWQELSSLAGRPVGVAWMQGAAAVWALGTILLRRLHIGIGTEALTVWMMVVGAVVFLALAPVFEPPMQPSTWSAATWWAIAFGIVINFGVGQAAWSAVARELPTHVSSFSVMAVPVVGILAAIVLIGEVPRATDWVAAAFIVMAIGLTNLAPAKKTTS